MQNVMTFFRMFRQLLEILNKKEKWHACAIALLSIVSALLETLGVSVILPFILALLQPETLMNYPTVSRILEYVGIESTKGIIVFVGTGVIVVYIAKNSFLLAFTFYKMYFRNSLERDLAIKMLQSYIYKPYSYFINVNSAEIIRGVTSDNSAVATVVDNYCALLNEGLTCIMIGIVLILINPTIAFTIVGFAILIALLMTLVMKKRIGVFACQSRDAFALRYKTVYEPINGIKEIIVMKRQKLFLEKFRKASEKACDANTKYQSMVAIPSRLTETIFLSILVFLVMISYNSLTDMSVLMAQLSALAVAAIRLLPSISNISNAMNSLVFQRPALESAYDNLVANRINEYKIYGDTESEEPAEHNTEQIQEREIGEITSTFINTIRIENISWKYAKELPNVLEGLSLDIHKGESIGLIGESGAGKTTLADIILGLFIPQSGQVSVDGRNIYAYATMWHRMIGYVPQSVFLLDDTVRNNILFGIDESELNEAWLQRAINQAQMRKFVEQLPNGIETVLGERGVKISGGQRQRIAIARALYNNPDILVLDEATSALDNETEAAVIDAINALHGEKTLIIVAHRLSTIENCDKVYEVVDGTAVRRR